MAAQPTAAPGFDHGPPRFAPADPAQITRAERSIGEAVGDTNMERTLAQAPNVLRGYLALENALARGSFRPRVVEQIAVAVAEHNQCLYCLSAHMDGAARLRVSEDELERNRRGESQDPRTAAALQFVHACAASRGAVSDEQLRRAREAGLSEAELMELVGLLALNVFTNYLNRLARPEVDFPLASATRMDEGRR